MNHKIIDINVDAGEGIGNESQLMPYIASCNIACGGHAGDENSIRTCLRLCKKHETLAGAHPGLPGNFGRGASLPTPTEFQSLLHHQWSLISSIAHEEKIPLHHIKLHGRLYSAVEENAELREVFLNFLKSLEFPLACFALASGCLPEAGKARGLEVWPEAFADRTYQDDGSLPPRTQPGAVLDQPPAIRDRIQHWLQSGTIPARSGKLIQLKAKTLCIHSDSPGVLATIELLNQLRRSLPNSELG